MLEIRQQADGSYRLAGVVMDYSDEGRILGGRERFERGSINIRDGVILNRMHDRLRPLARAPETLRLDDSAERLTLVAEMPATQDAADVHRLVQARVLRGLSLEFVATAERFDSGTRVIESADLTGVGVVDTGAYRLSEVEARGKAGSLTQTHHPSRRWFFL